MSFTEGEGSHFWSNGSAWGEFVIREVEGQKEAEFSVLSGEIQLEHFQVDAEEEVVFDEPLTLTENEPLILRF